MVESGEGGRGKWAVVKEEEEEDDEEEGEDGGPGEDGGGGGAAGVGERSFDSDVVVEDAVEEEADK